MTKGSFTSSLLLALFFCSCASSQEGEIKVQKQAADNRGERYIAETTSNFQVNDFMYAGELEKASNYGPMVCRSRIAGRYNIRSGPGVQNNRCSFLTPKDSTGADRVVSIIGMHGNWLKVSSKDTKSCQGGAGWIYFKGLKTEDYQKIQSGECGRVAINPRRGPVPEIPASTKTSVETKAPYSYPFVLDRCLGLKNDGGLGHYGASRRNGSHRYPHTGTDYYAPRGTAVHSPCNGKVTNSAYGSRAGNIVYIRCDDGALVKFMHMNSTPKRAAGGSRVSAGTVVGGVGNTGNARGQAPHLHVEFIHPRKGRIDPQSIWNCGGDSGH